MIMTTQGYMVYRVLIQADNSKNFMRDPKTQSVTVYLSNDSIKLFADDNDNYELECFLIDNGIFTNLRMLPVLAFLQNWLEFRTEPETKFAKSVVDSVQDLLDIINEAA